MAWKSGRIALDCGHSIGIVDWDKLWVGASTFCPTHKRQATVVSMARIIETSGSRDAQLGVMPGGSDPEGSSGSAPPDAPAP